MPTFVYMTRCDGCGHCVDICPSDIMHIDTPYRRAFNIEPNMCWECYAVLPHGDPRQISIRFSGYGLERGGKIDRIAVRNAPLRPNCFFENRLD
jgi:adenosine phosphosulfate reductase beta subunit